MIIIYRLSLLITLFLFLSISLQAQYASKKVRSVHEAYTDSLKNVDYDYIFPFLGKGTYKKGFDIPYPVGIMGNFMRLNQGIVIDDFQLGLQTDNVDIPLTNVDFIEFGNNYNTAYTVNIRPDLWILPFLNVYGIFGYGSSETEVNLVKPISLQSIVTQEMATAGVGVMAAFGIGPVWFSADANWTWSKPELLDQAVRVNVLGLRMGHTFVFNKRPDRNFAVWIGAMGMSMNSESSGQITLAQALPDLENQADQIVEDYDAWRDGNYDELTPAQKITVNTVLDPIVEKIDEADGSAIIKYGMDKQVKEAWNGLLGVQFQFNKHWMIRSEGGLIGDRKSFLLSLNYRFLL